MNRNSSNEKRRNAILSSIDYLSMTWNKKIDMKGSVGMNASIQTNGDDRW